MTKYRLTVTEDQARVIAEALELRARVGTGQLKYLDDVIWGYEDHAKRPDLIPEIVDNLESLEMACGLAITGYPRQFKSITNTDVPRDTRRAWDLSRVIRHRMAVERSSDVSSVDHLKPRNNAKEPFAVMERLEDETST